MNLGMLTRKEKKNYTANALDQGPVLSCRMIRLLPAGGHWRHLSFHFKERAWMSMNFYFRQIKQGSHLLKHCNVTTSRREIASKYIFYCLIGFIIFWHRKANIFKGNSYLPRWTTENSIHYPSNFVLYGLEFPQKGASHWNSVLTSSWYYLCYL